VAQIKFGKVLPTAVYVYWAEGRTSGKELNQLVAMLAARHELGRNSMSSSFRTDELKMSILSYPDFMKDAQSGSAPRGDG